MVQLVSKTAIIWESGSSGPHCELHSFSKPLVLLFPHTHALQKICALLGYYAALSGSSVPTFRDNLSVPSSRVKKSKIKKKS
jgi:hypothetical protein